jgi:hypothetical protein
MLTRESIGLLVRYEPESGKFFWLVNRGSRARVGNEAGWDRADGYRQIRIENKIYYAHRLAWLSVHDVWPELVDHINRNPADNRIINLRLANKSINAINSYASTKNTSGFKGVSWSKGMKKWRMSHQASGVLSRMYFDDAATAGAAYLKIVEAKC